MSKNRKNNGKRKKANVRSGRQRLNVRAKSRRGTKVRRWASWIKVAKIAGAAAFVLVLLIGVRRAVDHFLFESPKFKLSIIDYQSDGYLTKARVLGAADIEAGVNILRVDLEETRDKVLVNLPQVRQVEIIRDLPDRIAFKVQERFPVAWLGNIESPREPQKRRGGWLIDSEGIVLECERLEPRFVELPVIYSTDYADAKAGLELDGKPVATAIELIAAMDAGFGGSPVRLESLRVENRYSLIGYLNTGAQITFGLKEITRQVDDLQVLLAEATRRGRALATANLLVKKNIPVRFASAPGVGGTAVAPRALPVSSPVEALDRSAIPRRRVSRTAPKPVTSTRGTGVDPAVRSILRVD